METQQQPAVTPEAAPVEATPVETQPTQPQTVPETPVTPEVAPVEAVPSGIPTHQTSGDDYHTQDGGIVKDNYMLQ